MNGLFVYGLVDARLWNDGGAALRRSLAEAPGVDALGPPTALEVGRLGALVSPVPLADFSGQRFEANIEDVAWIEPRARAHAGVIALAFPHQAVLPMRFGTLFSSVDRMVAELNPREEDLLKELGAIEGLEEWTVRICANPELLLEEALAESESAAEEAGRGTQYLLRRRMALKGRPEMAARLITRAEEGHAALSCLALQVLDTRTEVTRLNGGQRSLVSRVYTIRQERRTEFLTELERVRELLAPEGFTVLQSGPWPPSRGEL